MAAKSQRIKIYLLIGLSVAMMGNVYLRFVRPKMGAPQTTRAAHAAKAAVAASPGPIAIPRVTIDEPVPGNPIQGPPPAEGAIRDLFAPAAALPAPEPPKPQHTASKSPPAFKVTGTISGGEKAIAVIDGRYVRTGERLGEFKVVRIGKKEVEIESEGRMVILKIMNNE